MSQEIFILIAEAILVYFLVLWAHSLRHRYGPVHFYALIGGLTAIMSWVTDAGMSVSVGGINFLVGSTVFYTSLLLGIFVIYVFDGPKITRVMIYTIVGVSAVVPMIAVVLHLQNALIHTTPLENVPLPSLRINAASVFTTLVDLVFLAMVWEFLGKHNRYIHLGMRTFLTLLGVMWLDVLLFNTLAFAGEPHYTATLVGTLMTRFAVAVFAFPMLFVYIQLQRKRKDVVMTDRPVLSILKKISDMEGELHEAQNEIQRRRKAEADLKKALDEVKTLKGMIPICAGCKSIRNDQGYWEKIESYLSSQTGAEFSHGMCPACHKKYYPDLISDRDGPT